MGSNLRQLYGSDLTELDYYVMADKIGEVSANTVQLLVWKDNLLDEA